MKTQFRQGDVLIERIANLPAGLTAVPHENNRVVLAYGEVTGHHHSFACTMAEKFVGADGAEFFRVEGQPVKGQFRVVAYENNQCVLDHPGLGPVVFADDDIAPTDDDNMVAVDGVFGLLTHDEHRTQAIPAGLYKGGGAEGKVYQREYTPEAIRRVAD